MVILVVNFDVTPEKRAEFLGVMDTLVPASVAEAGCIQYELFNDANDINKFVLFEKWQDQAALDFHNATDHLETCGGKLGELCTSIQINTFGEVQ